MFLYDNSGSTGSTRLSTIFRSGELQKKQVSKRGEEYGKLTAHISDDDIQKELDSLKEEFEGILEVICWRPRNEAGEIVHGQVEAYVDCIRNNRDKLDWCAFIDVDEYLFCRPFLSVTQVISQVEDTMPDVSRIQMGARCYECRWGRSGPKDITQFRHYLRHTPGGEKNFVKLKDCVAAAIHWDWRLKEGKKHIQFNPYEFGFVHYNQIPEKLKAWGVEGNDPREFLKIASLPDEFPEMIPPIPIITENVAPLIIDQDSGA